MLKEKGGQCICNPITSMEAMALSALRDRWELVLLWPVNIRETTRCVRLYIGMVPLIRVRYLKFIIWQLCRIYLVFSSERITAMEWEHLLREQQPTLITAREAISSLA